MFKLVIYVKHREKEQKRGRLHIQIYCGLMLKDAAQIDHFLLLAEVCNSPFMLHCGLNEMFPKYIQTLREDLGYLKCDMPTVCGLHNSINQDRGA